MFLEIACVARPSLPIEALKIVGRIFGRRPEKHFTPDWALLLASAVDFER